MDLYQSLRRLSVKFAKLQYFPLASFARSYRVTDEAFIAEPRYGPSSAFLMNIFFALKGSKLFILIGLLLKMCFQMIRHKPDCTTTEDGHGLEISDSAVTEQLMRLFLAYAKSRFSYDEAQIRKNFFVILLIFSKFK